MIKDALILLVVILSSRINCFEQLLVLILDLSLILFFGINLGIDSPDFILQLFQLLLVPRLELRHLQVSILLDHLCCLQRFLRMQVVLIQILGHVLKFVKVSKLSFFIIHDYLFLFFNGGHDLIHFLVEINGHAVHVVTLRLLRQQVHEPFLLLLDVNGVGSLAHAAGRVGSESKEVTENI